MDVWLLENSWYPASQHKDRLDTLLSLPFGVAAVPHFSLRPHPAVISIAVVKKLHELRNMPQELKVLRPYKGKLHHFCRGNNIPYLIITFGGAKHVQQTPKDHFGLVETVCKELVEKSLDEVPAGTSFVSLSCQGTVRQKKAAPGLGGWKGRQHRAATSKGAALRHLHQASRPGMVAAAGDSHGPAVVLMPLFPRTRCRAARRHHLRAQAASPSAQEETAEPLGVLKLEYSGPQILCIPNSKTRGVDLESPLVLSARGSSSRTRASRVEATGHVIPALEQPEGAFQSYSIEKCHRLNNPHSLSCSSQDLFSRPFTSFVALLWTRSRTSTFLVVRGPKLNTVFEDAIGFLGHLGTLRAHIQVALDQHSQVLFRWAAFQPLFPKPPVLHRVVVTQVQDPALDLVEPHTVGLGPWIQPVQVPLQSLPTLKQINAPAQFGVVCKFTEGALNPLLLNRTGPNTEPWGTPIVTGRQLDLNPFTITLWARPSSQFFTQQKCPIFQDFFALQDCVPRDFINEAPKQAKVCPLEVQGSSSADPPPYFSNNQKLYHFVIVMAKTASNHHITHKSVFVCKQQVQQGNFPSWFTYQLCQEVIFHTLQEPPRLLPLRCVVFPADIWGKDFSLRIEKFCCCKASYSQCFLSWTCIAWPEVSHGVKRQEDHFLFLTLFAEINTTNFVRHPNCSDFSLVQGMFKGSCKEEQHQKDSNTESEILGYPQWISVLLT
ncbi:hypothetical protein QYF61_022544, partial [Mycteria americana]